jgi:hypothetical protein
VWYGTEYRDSTGVNFLQQSGILIEQLNVQS